MFFYCLFNIEIDRGSLKFASIVPLSWLDRRKERISWLVLECRCWGGTELPNELSHVVSTLHNTQKRARRRRKNHFLFSAESKKSKRKKNIAVLYAIKWDLGKVSVSIFTRAFRVLIEHYPIRHAVNANWLSMIRHIFMVFCYLWIWLIWTTDRAGFMMRLGTKRSTGIFWVWGFRWIIMVFDINFDVISNENKRKKNLALILVKTRENIFFNWIDTGFFRWILF